MLACLEPVADLARDQHRRSGRVAVTFPLTWNVLGTWPILSVLTEAPFFLCAREKWKRILNHCADTARVVGRFFLGGDSGMKEVMH